MIHAFEIGVLGILCGVGLLICMWAFYYFIWWLGHRHL